MFTSKWQDSIGHDSRLLLGSTALELPGMVANKENGSQVSRLQKKKESLGVRVFPVLQGGSYR